MIDPISEVRTNKGKTAEEFAKAPEKSRPSCDDCTPSLQLQLLFVVLAAVLVASLSVILTFDAVRSAEGVVVNDAAKALTTAVSELDQQYRDRLGRSQCGVHFL